MKLKNKIITGMFALSILGAGTFAINSFNNVNVSVGQTDISKIATSNSSLKQQTKIETLEEMKTYIPNIDIGTDLYIEGHGYIGATGREMAFYENPIEDGSTTTTVFLEESPRSPGDFYLKVKNASGDFLYATQYEADGTMYANQNSSETADVLEAWVIEGQLVFLWRGFNSHNSENEHNQYYDVVSSSIGFGEPAQVIYHTTDFPTEHLDSWNTKIKLNIQAEIIGEVIYPSSDSLSFNLMQPKANINPLEQTNSFDVYIDNVMTETISYNNPGTEEEFIINSTSIDNSKVQEIKLDFGLYFDQLVFNTAILDHSTSSLLSASKFDDTKITVKIDDFVNGESWTAADEFQFIINGDDALPSNIFDISLIQGGTYEGFADVTGYDHSQPITVKVRYLDDSGLESFSNEITLDGDDVTPPPVGTPFNPGEITTKNITQKTATVSFANLTQGSDLQEVETFEISGTSTSSVDNPEGATKAISVPNQLLGDIREVNLTGLLIESSNTIDIVFKNNIGDVVATETVTFNTPAFTEVLASTTGLEVAYDTSVFNGVNLKWSHTQGVDKWGAITEPGPVVVTLTFHNMVTGARANTGTFTFTADPQGGAYAINFDDMIAAGQITQENIDGGFSINSDTTTGLPENGFDTRSGGYKMPGWMLALIITFSILTTIALAWLFILLFKRRKEKAQEKSLSSSDENDEIVIARMSKVPSISTMKAYTSKFRLIHNQEVINRVVTAWECNLGIDINGKTYEPEPVIIKVKFNNMPQRSNANTFEFTVDATKKIFTINFDKMIKEKKIMQINVDGGFIVEFPTSPAMFLTKKK